MIDLHTHILCGVDDGAKTAEESLKLLRMERDQGVTAVVLTPHFYRVQQHSDDFLEKRAAAFDRLQEHLQELDATERESLPEILLGAEVAWHPNMALWDDVEKFCIQGTKNMLLELPFVPWDTGLSRQLYNLINHTGITPILVHLERYIPMQKKKQVEEILELGLPVQISSSAFLHRATKNLGMNALKNGWAHLIATDCHDPVYRKPDLKDAMDVIGKKLGDGMVRRLHRHSQAMLEQ